MQYDEPGRDVVVTRRPMLEDEAHERRKHALELLQEGQVMKGVVRTVVEWGAFVALPEAENLEGLGARLGGQPRRAARSPSSSRPGDELEVKITKIDERGKIWLSRKALIDDPWEDARNGTRPARGTRARSRASRSSAPSSSSSPASTA